MSTLARSARLSAAKAAREAEKKRRSITADPVNQVGWHVCYLTQGSCDCMMRQQRVCERVEKTAQIVLSAAAVFVRRAGLKRETGS